MSLVFNEDSFMEAPFLLVEPEKQYFFFPSIDGQLFWQAGSRGEWSPPQPLPRSGPFCAAIDGLNRVHLVICENGCFYHLQPGEGAGEKIVYDHEEKQCSHLLLNADQFGSLHLIYLAVNRQADRWWLFHHQYRHSAWEEPRVIDYGAGTALNYGHSAVDRNQGLHLIYKIEEEEKSSLHYHYFSATAQAWSNAVPLAAEGRNRYPCIFVDEVRNIHTLWSSERGEQHLVCYRQKKSGGWPTGGWREEVLLSPPLNQAPFPFFLLHQEVPLPAWFYEEALWLCRQPHSRERLAAENSAELHLARCGLILEDHPPRSGWTLLQGAQPALWPEKLPDPLPEGEADAEAWEDDFHRLHEHSRVLLGQASQFKEAKTVLEQALEQKKSELFRLSRQTERKMGQLHRDLAEKEEELQQLQQKFEDTVNSLKAKMEQSRKNWDHERKRLLTEIQELKNNQQKLHQACQNREKDLKNLENRCRKLEQENQKLSSHNLVLARELEEARNLGFWKIIGKVIQKKTK